MERETDDTLTLLREATGQTEYENRLWIVGGYVRDKLLQRKTDAARDDIDLVLEGDAPAVARLLYKKRVATHAPVEFPAFGTAMVHVGGAQVELVTARSETYRQGSRKPIVRPGTLETDARRRDFTVNTFLENLHTGEVRDPTGQGYADLAARILRTPADPEIIFRDDPLRMLRGCRFAAKLGFAIAPETYAAIVRHAALCRPEHGIAFERIHDELNKTLLTDDAQTGLELLRATGLLAQFAPELAAMHGVTQNRFHKHDVWTHTLTALSHLPDDAPLPVRLAVLFHDIGKPTTRAWNEKTGDFSFYGHQDVGAEITKTVLTRLRYPSETIKRVTELVALHMRYGEYRADTWTDASVRRLIRSVGEHRGDLFTITRADSAACDVEAFPVQVDLAGLSERMEKLDADAQVTGATSPLSGAEIIALLGIRPGPLVGKIKGVLTDAVVAGELGPNDTGKAAEIARSLYDAA